MSRKTEDASGPDAVAEAGEESGDDTQITRFRPTGEAGDPVGVTPARARRAGSKEDDATVLRPPGDDPSVTRSDSFRDVTPSGPALIPGSEDTPRVLKQRFVLEEQLGSGGMGTVYRAKDLRKVEARDRQPYLAIKVLNADFRRHPDAFIALEREASKSQTMSHPNIVSIFDFDKDGDLPFIMMELLEGRELAKLLKDYPSGMPDSMAWMVIETMCRGLQYAHDAGVVHADFKPGNVFVSSQHQAKVLDFGIARAVRNSAARGDDTVFDPGRLAALTPAYASREMLSGDSPEPRDDIFALGVVAYQVLTGRHPYGRTPADEAARERLKLERPKRLGWWRWRTLSKMLAFNRQDRPDTLAEVIQGLFSPPPWRTKVTMTAVLTLLVSLVALGSMNTSDMNEVREEVRQNTLMHSQTQRLIELLNDPVFDDRWERQVRSEFESLERIDPTHELTIKIKRLIRDGYANRVYNTPEFETAYGLYKRGLEYGALGEVEVWLKDKLLTELHALLDAPQMDEEWLLEVELQLLQFGHAFPGATEFQEVRTDVSDALIFQVEDGVARGRIEFAEAALESARAIVFDEVVVDELAALVDDAQADYRARMVQEEAVAARSAFADDLAAVTGQSCLSLDGESLRQAFDGLLAGHPRFESWARDELAGYVAGCVKQLAGVDQDRARVLKGAGLAVLGDVPVLASVRIDPCGMSYLVGKGATGGRGTYCSDPLPDDTEGPPLVVVPRFDQTGTQPFAITKREISWDLFGVYCTYTGRCEPDGPVSMPVTGVTVAQITAFGHWLSEQTGYTYRLPTLEEWQLAAAGTPDPNRNCRVRVSGVERGLQPVPAGSGRHNGYGLLNVLGNVQELVTVGDGLRAMGGAFVDPIDQCSADTSRVHSGRADAVTGFRLVRELS